jgi:P27 family predicted phage terminase small subunit
MRGPKPVPSSVKALRGNPGHRPLNQAEPTPEGGKLTCPQFLSGPARREWYRLRPILEKMGTLKAVDQNILAAYCQAYGRYVDAEKVLKEKGPLYRTKSDNVITSPMLWVSNKAVEQMLKLGAELGIGAATRSRVNVEDKDGRKDSMELLLSGDRTN